jgi:short-subunit dehydrogenase
MNGTGCFILYGKKMEQTALVTGAASGLGREFARLLAKDGYRLVLVDADSKGLHGAGRDLGKEFGDAPRLVAANLAEPGAALKLWKEIAGEKIDILINNAGFGLYGYFAETEWEREQEMLRLHVMTVTHLTKLALGRMVEQGSGKILNVSSMAAFQPGPLMSVYYASKAYILSFSEALANELKGTGVTVTVLAPGWFRTNFQKTTAVYSHVEESRSKLHTATAEKVALKGYRAMMRGKGVVVPGLSNTLMSMAPRVLPRRTMTAIVRYIQVHLRK